MSQVQSGILPEHCRAAIWIEANVNGDVDALRAASKIFIDKLATFQATFRMPTLARLSRLAITSGAS
ncbi:Dyp-type peroxidase family protein [Enterobacter cancerogenus]|uniref:Dyp-type peroxidase family protein n=1 Tax=Enterobacter cancerogenus TaxID=69218 RepID=A0A484YWN9_9ENTR|nr:Dyp-type peroxidase family protein [Enterobacter cancerogenus]